jgi:hypothetical protein
LIAAPPHGDPELPPVRGAGPAEAKHDAARHAAGRRPSTKDERSINLALDGMTYNLSVDMLGKRTSYDQRLHGSKEKDRHFFFQQMVLIFASKYIKSIIK